MMLDIQNLTCSYDSIFCLKNMNFKIKDGELIGIIGPNGSGKTTLLRAISGIIKPKTGEILFKGKNIKKMSFKELAQEIAVVSQIPEINLNMSVEEFTLLGRTPHRRRRQFFDTKNDERITQEALVLTNTLQFKDRPIGDLSGGEKQLILIARALTQQPQLLLLDEPTNHLDIAHQVKILDLIKRLNYKNHLTTVIVLHDLNLASQYCDKLILLNGGSIHSIGSPQNVLTYQAIEKVYKTSIIAGKNPVSLKPHIFLVSEEEKKGETSD